MTTARPEPAPRPLPGDDPELRLSVWATAQRDARTQRRGRYLPASTAHPAKMLPAIAATAIARYTEPGDLVADPMCGIGTTLVEAVHLGRDGLGIEYEDRWASASPPPTSPTPAARARPGPPRSSAATPGCCRGCCRPAPRGAPPSSSPRRPTAPASTGRS